LKKFAIGIDVGGTRTKIGLLDLDLGQVLEMQIVPTETKDAARFEPGYR
jgi:glucokinase